MHQLPSPSPWAPFEGALRTLAPIDDGTDASDMAERLLRAAPRLTDARLGSRCREGQHFAWHGCLSEPNILDGTLRLSGADLDAEVDLTAVLAVSYCADAAASGICLYDEEGAFLTLWSAKGEAFDAWLADTVRGFACPLERGDPSLPGWAEHRAPAPAR
ncbi:MAG: hypothetical protein ABL916_20985 [Burkholderiaceae bacterium]